MIIEWTDDILIGLPDLDDDHRRLVAGINEIDDALLAGRAAAALMQEWVDLFRRHAGKEEELLSRLHLPAGVAHLAEHAAGHRDFLGRADAFARRLRADAFAGRLRAGRPCGDEITRLGDHLMVTEMIRADFDMVGHLRREGLLLPDGSLRAAE